MSGWVKLHRAFDKWEWRDKPEMVSLFINILLEANHEERQWHGITIERGQCLFGRDVWSKKLGISPQSLRTCIERLKSTNEITSKSTNRFTVLSVVKYDEYQVGDSESTSESTSKSTNNQQTTNKQSTTPKEDKKERKEYMGSFSGFWEIYPRQRRGDKDKAYSAWVKALTKATEKEIMDGLQAYIGSSEVSNGYAKGAEAWLNASKWTDRYNPKDKPRKPFNTWKN